MTKKRRLGRLVILTLALCLVSFSLLSNTLAKYTSTVTGTDSATVANWSFDVDSTDITPLATTTFTFDLFNTTTTPLAPGQTGNITINLANTSEVDAKYSIDFTETNTGNVPIQYSADGTTWVDEIADITATAIAKDATATVTLHWRWVTTDDATDTGFGIAETLATVTVAAALTAEQDATNITVSP